MRTRSVGAVSRPRLLAFLVLALSACHSDSRLGDEVRGHCEALEGQLKMAASNTGPQAAVVVLGRGTQDIAVNAERELSFCADVHVTNDDLKQRIAALARDARTTSEPAAAANDFRELAGIASSINKNPLVQ